MTDPAGVAVPELVLAAEGCMDVAGAGAGSTGAATEEEAAGDVGATAGLTAASAVARGVSEAVPLGVAASGPGAEIEARADSDVEERTWGVVESCCLWRGSISSSESLCAAVQVLSVESSRLLIALAL